jgi:putative inorganic carbon (HCO3(-)) transporter
LIFYYLLILVARFHNDPRLGTALFHAGPILVTPVKLVGFLALFAAILSERPTDSAPRLRSSLGVLFLTFAIVPVLISSAFAQNLPADPISSLLSFGFLLVCTRLLITTQDRLVKSVRVIVIASTFGSLWLYKQHFLGHMARPEGIEGDCNYEALTLVINLPLAVWMAFHERTSWWRRIGLSAGAVTGTAIILTQSRAGLIALVVAGLATILYSQRKLLATLTICAVSSLVVAFAPPHMFDRFHHIALSGEAQNGDEISTRTHMELLKAGLNMIETHPVFGVGLDQFKTVAPHYNSNLIEVGGRSYIAHNSYVQIAAECGLPMLVVFLAILITALGNCRSTRKLPDGSIPGLAFAIQVGLIGFCVAGASVSAEYVTALWILVFLSQSVREIGFDQAQIHKVPAPSKLFTDPNDSNRLSIPLRFALDAL